MLGSWFTRDDLFWRALLFCSGLVLCLIALLVSKLTLLGPTARTDLPWVAGFAFMTIALAGWGGLLIVGSFAAPKSRWRRIAGKLVPDYTGREGIPLIVLVGLPALLLVWLLRSLGVHGTPPSAYGDDLRDTDRR